MLWRVNTQLLSVPWGILVVGVAVLPIVVELSFELLLWSTKSCEYTF